jgi:integrase/recombinase XerD
MPRSVKKPTAAEMAPDWLWPYCKQFLQKLADQGYASATMRTYDAAARLLCQEIAHRGLRKGELVGAALSNARAAALKAMHPNKYFAIRLSGILLGQRIPRDRRWAVR